MSISLGSSDPRATVDHTVNKRYQDQSECYADLQAHMTIHIQPGRMWAGTVRHPNGQFKQCQ